ncbi:hypothetical protein EDB19DRAFT_1710164 [Suillus lakei]|nr:hypothetical protein EDB19DRAFT_1757459 [Suillus lakei]KAG1739667.1 hypothetical protein EDB19DRAFT_1710164 [Suillus lakei]
MPSTSDSKCILVVGSTAGIGRALALALAILDLPSQPTERLEELSVTLDVLSERDALKSFIEEIVNTYPDLDAVLFSSGIQRAFDFTKLETIDLESLECELATNHTSVVRMITFFLPRLIKLGEQGCPTFLYTVSSGLLSISLAVQLKEKNVHVVEIMPPLVELELHDFEGTTQRLSDFWLSLEKYTKATMEGLVRDDPYVPARMVVEQHKKFEEGELEAATKMYGQIKATTQT